MLRGCVLAGALALSLLTGACHHATPEEVDDFSAVARDLAARDLAHDAGDEDLGAVACDPAGPLGGVAGVSGDAGDTPAFVGGWQIVGGCASADALYQISTLCSGATFSDVQVTGPAYVGAPFGTLELFGNGTFNRDSHVGLVATFSVPESCVMGAGGCGAYAGNLMTEYNWIDAMTCSQEQPQGCRCTVSAEASVSESGGYRAAGEELELDVTNASAEYYDVGLDATTLRARGLAADRRGSRGITFVLTR